MGIGDVYSVEAVSDCYYVDTGMYGGPEYGSVYIYDTDSPAIIDTGIGTHYERILDALDEVGIEPADLEYILPTHVHLDHAGGAGFLTKETDADVYVHKSGATFLEDPEPLWKGTKAAVGEQIRCYTKPKPVPKDRLVSIEEGDTIDLGGTILDVYHAPGHAFHQVIFHDADASAVFSADAAGIYVPPLDAVIETSPPPGFDLETVIDDARKIAELRPDTICYAHFGPAAAEGRIDEYIDVITAWVERIVELRSRLGDDEAVIERLIETSDMFDVWDEKRASAEIEMDVRGVMHYLDQKNSE